MYINLSNITSWVNSILSHFNRELRLIYTLPESIQSKAMNSIEHFLYAI